MGTHERDDCYFHHTDSIRRWSTRESFEFMRARPWEEVLEFYGNVVNDKTSLTELFEPQLNTVHDYGTKFEACSATECDDTMSGNRITHARVTFKIVLSYHGNSFDGWQKQPGLNTVQSVVERSLGTFIDAFKSRQLEEKGKPLIGYTMVAGRTDKGVSAIGQVCSFYTWRKDVKSSDIKAAIDNAAPGQLSVISVSEVPRVFHPNFSAKWRRYLYIFPFDDEENAELVGSTNHEREGVTQGNTEGLMKVFSVVMVNGLLQKLEGKLLSYNVFARATMSSRNAGPATQCFIYHARAAKAKLPYTVQNSRRMVMCIELVANRFLRKMVRVLVATAIREAAAGADENALLKLMDSTCRRATAPPAPPHGLCLVDVGYTDFCPSSCIIPK